MKNKFTMALTLSLVLAMVLTSFALAQTSSAPASQNATPTISSDLPDYGPGGTVNLFGTGWQAGEKVHIFVNDDLGLSWSRNIDVVAGDDGTITDSFQLPNWFVADYSVIATGATSGTATTTFTDAYPTTTTVTSNKNPSNVGESVTFTATVINNGTGNPVTVGQVKFGTGLNCTGGFTQLQAAQGVGTTTPNIGKVTFTTNALTTTTTIRACYIGTGGAGSQDSFGTIDQVVSAPADTTPPVIAAHADVTTEATSAAGAAVTYTAPATSDAVDGAGVATCAPASGGTFALGNTTVTCNATDAAGNHAVATTFVVHVVDTTKPVIASHLDVTTEATSALGAVVTYTAPATSDAIDGAGSATCLPASGGTFALGNTTVTCNKTDTHGNAATPTTFVLHVVDTTAPTIAENPPMMAEATGPDGAMVPFSNPAASDTVDTSVDVVCVPQSGSTFALGANTVTCTATDDSGNHISSSFTVTVQDTTAPVIAAHGNETAEATSSLGAIVSYTAPATSDIVDGAGLATCAPASGTQFALGNTTVKCDADDVAGNHATQTSFVVHVVDTTAPVIASHLAVTEEATSALGAIVGYTAPATSDAVDGTGTATCAPISGSQFALGNTTVKCDADDVAGNHATQTSFVVHVVDTTAPVIASHLDVTEEATSALGAIVDYTAPATSDAVDGAKTATCDPASGTQFALGDTTVKCDAVDAAGNHATQTSFVVHVVDTTPPTITFDSRTPPNGNGWNNGDVTVNWNCTDLVGVVSASVSKTVSTEGTNQSATGTCEDTSGNKASNTQTGINIDKTNPTASASRAPDANANGWNNSDVTVLFSGTDDRSGIASCSSDVVLGEGAGQSASGICTDKAGNVSDAATISNINVDKTAPSASASRAPDANANGWNNSAVTVSFSGSDGLSGLASCDAAVVLSGEGADQSAAGYCYDKAGNTSNKAEVTGINIDLTAPIISAALDKTAVSGWFNIATGAPTVEFTCSDDLSGLAGACPASHLFGDGAGLSHSQTIHDLAGNSASAGVTGVNVDTVAPTISGAPDRAANGKGWYNADVTVTFTCGDASPSSGVASCSAPSTLGEGAAQSLTGNVADIAGNTASATVSGINIDKTAPIISAELDFSPAASGWFNISTGIPTVEFTCSDALSGIDTCPDDFKFVQGADQSHSGTAYDKAGNSASAGVSNVDVDTVAPAISVALDRSAAASGWFNEVTAAPIAKFTCSDGTSGIVACPADYTFGNGENQSHSGTVSDNAGNSASASVTNVDVDLTDPTITWNGGPAAGGNYDFGYVPAAPTCIAVDGLSGQNGCTVAGYAATVGSHTMTATAYDVAGNMYSESRSYNVEGWVLKGFYQPVDMNNVYNVVKNGSTVPLKFEVFTKLSGVEITDVSFVKLLTYAQVSCSLSSAEDLIETVATGGTVLRYDSTGGQFIFNWKTPNTAGKCYRVTMTTLDGAKLEAFFKLK